MTRTTLQKAAVPAMWVLAGVLLTLLFLRGDPLAGAPRVFGSGGQAFAGLVAHAGNMAILTSEAGNEDIVLVLDGRTEQILAYRANTSEGIKLVQRASLPQLFLDARTRAQGRD